MPLPDLGRLSLRSCEVRTGADAGPSDAPADAMVDDQPETLGAYVQRLKGLSILWLEGELPADPIFVPYPETYAEGSDRLRVVLVEIANRLKPPGGGVPPPYALMEDFSTRGGIQKLAVILDTMVKYQVPVLLPEQGFAGVDPQPIREVLVLLQNLVPSWWVHSHIETVGLIATIETYVVNTEALNVKVNLSIMRVLNELVKGEKLSHAALGRIGFVTWWILKATLHESELPEPLVDSSTLQDEYRQQKTDMQTLTVYAVETMWLLALVPDWCTRPAFRPSPGAVPQSWFDFFATHVLPQQVRADREEESEQIGVDLGEWGIPKWKKTLALKSLPTVLRGGSPGRHTIDGRSVERLVKLLSLCIAESMSILNIDLTTTPTTTDGRLKNPPNEYQQHLRLEQLLAAIEPLLYRTDVQEQARTETGLISRLIRLVNIGTRTTPLNKTRWHIFECIHHLVRGNEQNQQTFRDAGILAKLPVGRNGVMRPQVTPLYYLLRNDSEQLARLLSFLGPKEAGTRIRLKDYEELSQVLPDVIGSAFHVAILNTIGVARLWRTYRGDVHVCFGDEMRMAFVYKFFARFVGHFTAAKEACRTEVPEMFGDIVCDALKCDKDPYKMAVTASLVLQLVQDNYDNKSYFGHDFQCGQITVNFMVEIMYALHVHEADMTRNGMYLKDSCLKCLFQLARDHDDNLDRLRTDRKRTRIRSTLFRYRDGDHHASWRDGADKMRPIPVLARNILHLIAV